jgi:hypothetical protein
MGAAMGQAGNLVEHWDSNRPEHHFIGIAVEFQDVKEGGAASV